MTSNGKIKLAGLISCVMAAVLGCAAPPAAAAVPSAATLAYDAGETRERELPEAQDQGFLWRLDSYWRFEQADRGVYIQCEAISLTRDIPTGLGWLVKPLIRDIPANSLRFTLTATRDALVRNSAAIGRGRPGTE